MVDTSSGHSKSSNRSNRARSRCRCNGARSRTISNSNSNSNSSNNNLPTTTTTTSTSRKPTLTWIDQDHEDEPTTRGHPSPRRKIRPTPPWCSRIVSKTLLRVPLCPPQATERNFMPSFEEKEPIASAGLSMKFSRGTIPLWKCATTTSSGSFQRTNCPSLTVTHPFWTERPKGCLLPTTSFEITFDASYSALLSSWVSRTILTLGKKANP
mmetsp:Transcript_13410/g.29309  ORF Transcript_13410/g.29309 Transcript_13410/m.29309 type:complete len:211 (-) Transcript_13410:126-758(-)